LLAGEAVSSQGDAEAIEYILKNRGKYPREQIDAALLKNGHAPSGIEAFWAGVEEGYADVGRELNEERELRHLSKGWSLPILVRTYESNPKGEAAFTAEAAILGRHRYQPSMQSAEGSHLHAGRLLLTGGLSVFAGRRGIRSKGKLTVTFQRVAGEPSTRVAAQEQDDPVSQIRKLAELRDAGILTDDEFTAKKAELLGRM
jgi:hypothetical protein